jgi:alkanesulfonate monooxygenase SsuD/methylene tetrahydromethanopterin reductase-like flavin-dependent oxidoreductase (luciferase family)
MDPNCGVDEPMVEAYTTLGYLAASTTRIRLGAMVTWASIRPPALLVKAVTTLDVLSGGRAWLGIGAGYQADEARMVGLPFAPTAERFDRLDEVLELAAHMWSRNQAPFAGPFHQLQRPICSPPPVSTPKPRILIGGMGEQRTLPLVARYADACNLFDVPDGGAILRRKLDVIDRVCDDIGRDRGEIETTISTRLEEHETSSDFAARCRALHDLGIDHAVVLATHPWSDDRLDVLAAAADELRAE